VEGVVQAATKQTALEELRRQQLFPVDVREVAADAARRSLRLSRGTALALWARTCATMLGAGVTLDRALGFSSEHAGNDDVARALATVRAEVESGSTLAASVERSVGVFGPVAPAMIAAGEASGALDRAFATLARHLEETDELRSQLRAVLIYPAIMACVALIGLVVLFAFVVPRFSRMLQEVGGSLPLSTRLLVGASDVVARTWWLWLALGIVAVLGARSWLARAENRTRWHAARLRWPLVGPLERVFAAATFTRTLGMLLESGLGILPALQIANGGVPNLALRAGLDRAAARVRDGERLSSALGELLPPLAVQLLSVGEESGQLEALSLRAAESFETELRRTLRTLVGLVEPVLILFFGLVVGFVALALLQAIYSVNTTIGVPGAGSGAGAR
jgi:type II secretory pathway component PulF